MKLPTPDKKRLHLAFVSGKDLAGEWSGGEVRIIHLARFLAPDVDLSLFHRHSKVWSPRSKRCFAEAELSPPIESAPGKIVNKYWRLFQDLRRAHCRRPFDLVLASHISSLPAVLCFWAISRVPFVFDNHNVEAELAMFERGLLGRAAITILEYIGCRTARLTLAVSDRDAEILGKFAKRVLVVPNGTAMLDKPPAEPARGRVILFFGNMNYEPNRDAALFIVKHISPAVRKHFPDTEFRIAGRNSHSIPGDGVTLLGYAEDLVTELDAAALVIVPVRSGSGTRIKILDALGRYRPVISTPKGAEGLPAFDAVRIENIDQFPTAVIQHLQKYASKAYRFSEADRKQIEAFRWKYIAEKLVPFITALAKAKYPYD